MILRLSIANADITGGEVPVYVETLLEKSDLALSCAEFKERLTGPMTEALLHAHLNVKADDVSVKVELPR